MSQDLDQYASVMDTADAPVVLLVDDQRVFGAMVRQMLSKEPGVVFHFCQSGAEAVALAARLRPTVILQDLVMPDADGLDLISQYRAHESTAQTPLIVLSSEEEPTTKAEAFRRGANDYLLPGRLRKRPALWFSGNAAERPRRRFRFLAHVPKGSREPPLVGQVSAARHVHNRLPPTRASRARLWPKVSWRLSSPGARVRRGSCSRRRD